MFCMFVYITNETVTLRRPYHLLLLALAPECLSDLSS